MSGLIAAPIKGDIKAILQNNLSTNNNTDDALSKKFAGLQCAHTTLPELKQFFTKSSSPGIAPQHGALYLVDPHGNLIMAYPAAMPAKSLLTDMTRLLNTSQIG